MEKNKEIIGIKEVQKLYKEIKHQSITREGIYYLIKNYSNIGYCKKVNKNNKWFFYKDKVINFFNGGTTQKGRPLLFKLKDD